MKFRLNGTEMMDWQELWCFRCENDHTFSHVPDGDNGCDILADLYLTDGECVEFQPIREDWWRTLPSSVACSEFTLCTKCPDESPDAERRGGETRREFYDRLRAEMIKEGVAQ